MASQAAWAREISAVNNPASFEIEDTISANVVLENKELGGNRLPRIVGNSAALGRVLDMVRIVRRGGVWACLLEPTSERLLGLVCRPGGNTPTTVSG
jgi:hypothetical protein